MSDVLTAREAARQANLTLPAFYSWAARRGLKADHIRIGRSFMAVYDRKKFREMLASHPPRRRLNANR